MLRYFSPYILLVLFWERSTGTQRDLQVIPERVEINYINKKYLANATCTVRKLGRRGAYVVHLHGFLLHTWANNVSLNIIMYEYLHNEYKPTFVEFHYRLCDFINKDAFIGAVIKKHGIVCPVLKGHQSLSNGTMHLPSFPYLIPFTKAMAEVTFKRTEPSEELIGIGHLYIHIKQTV